MPQIIISVVPSALWLWYNLFCRGSVLCTPPPAWELASFQDFLSWKLKMESWKLAMSYELWAVLPKARSSLLVARCVRDCSGILCEWNRKWDSGTGIWEFGDIFERGKIKRAKIERKARRRSCMRRRNAQRELKIERWKWKVGRDVSTKPWKSKSVDASLFLDIFVADVDR